MFDIEAIFKVTKKNSETFFNNEDCEITLKLYKEVQQIMHDNEEADLNNCVPIEVMQEFIAKYSLLSNYYLKFGKTLFIKFVELGIIK